MNHFEINNLTMLSEFLYVDEQKLSEFLSGNDISRYCLKMTIPKKNKRLGFRTVYKVNNITLKNIHKVLQKYLNAQYEFPTSVHGFVPGRSTQTNALTHLSRRIIMQLDIENFFGSVTENDIVEVFERVGYKCEIAASLAKLTTIDGTLVQGFNTSPILANMAFINMDHLLESLCQKYHSNYTRYADDITISSGVEIPSISEIESLFAKSQFRLNKAKTKIMLRGKKQFVTGLSVFDNQYPRVPKQFKKRIRLRLYYIKKYGCMSYAMREMGISEIEAAADHQKSQTLIDRSNQLHYEIKGWIDYVNAIEPLLAKKFYNIYNSIRW